MDSESLLIWEAYTDSILEESTYGYKTLYHIGTAPPSPRPLDRYFRAHHQAVERLSDSDKTGVFLTDRPDVMYKAIRDELNTNGGRVDRYKRSSNRRADSNLLKIWSVKVPNSVIYNVGGLRNNPNVHYCREIVIPARFWNQVQVSRSTKSLDSFKSGFTRSSAYDQQQKDWSVNYRNKYAAEFIVDRMLKSSLSDIKMLLSTLDDEKYEKIIDKLKDRRQKRNELLRFRYNLKSDGDSEFRAEIVSDLNNIDRVLKIISADE